MIFDEYDYFPEEFENPDHVSNWIMSAKLNAIKKYPDLLNTRLKFINLSYGGSPLVNIEFRIQLYYSDLEQTEDQV